MIISKNADVYLIAYSWVW